MANAIALIDDLFFLAKVRETAKQAGVTLETATTGEQLVKAAEASPGAVILVDLNAKQGALEAVQRLCNANGPAFAKATAGTEEPATENRPAYAENPATEGRPRRIIAFLSHVQTDLAERARAAGCAEVMPRSKFTQNLAEILREAKS